MDRVNHELSVLSRAVAYKNLSGASVHVGLSQPQLSRIIKRLEESMSVVLLDRSAKRNATWTPFAYKLAEFYSKKMRAFDHELDALLKNTQTKQIRLGTLEGLSNIALQFAHGLFRSGIRLIEVDVYDQDRLEELFMRGELDLIFSVREPGRKKFRYARELGFQSLDQMNADSPYEVMSTFESSARKERLKSAEKILVSNSLYIRKEWFRRYGGKGTLPSEVRKQKTSRLDTERVVLLGSDTLSPLLWTQIEAITFQ